MAPSTAERQRQHRRPVRGFVGRIDVEIPVEVAATLRYLAHQGRCTRRVAIARRLLAAGGYFGGTRNGASPLFL